MNELRWFEVEVVEASYRGKLTVSVDRDAIEWDGNEAIQRAAWREWRRRFGPPVSACCYTHCKILREVH
jgi:hypothetical protein